MYPNVYDQHGTEDHTHMALPCSTFMEMRESIMGQKNRLRDKQINVRVTDYEYAVIQERMKKSGSASMTEFIIDAATNGFLINVDYSEIKTLSYELNRIGNNINQIAHHINSEGVVYKTQIEEVQEYMDLIWKMMRSKFYQIP